MQDDDNNEYRLLSQLIEALFNWMHWLIKYGFMLVEIMLKVSGHFLSLLKACTVISWMWLELDLGQVHCNSLYQHRQRAFENLMASYVFDNLCSLEFCICIIKVTWCQQIKKEGDIVFAFKKKILRFPINKVNCIFWLKKQHVVVLF